MLSIEPNGEVLGATVHGADLRTPLSKAEIGTVLFAIGKHGLVRFPEQNLTPAQQLAFARQFGETQVVAVNHIPEHKDMSVLSNMVENGQPLGISDAGIIWHRDMTYQEVPGFANILHAIKVPRRDGRALGNTEFVDSQAAYDDLPADMKTRLKGAVGVHTGAYYQNIIREKFGAAIGESHEKRHNKPPKAHPIVITHPISGRQVLYCDVGHVARIDGLPEGEGEAALRFLNEHQIQPKYQYSHSWTEGDVLMWDNLRSLHRGVFDYRADEPRLIRRCQILSDKILDPSFIKSALAQVPELVAQG